MDERLEPILQILKARIHPEAKTYVEQVSLRELLGEGKTYKRSMLLPEARMTIATPDRFPHGNRLWCGLLAPVLYYAFANSKSLALTDSSALDLANMASHETHNRYLLTSLLRSWLHVSNILEEQEVSPDAKRTFLEMQSGPDIDCRLRGPKKDFYQGMRDVLLPRMAAALVDGYDVRNAHDFVLWARNPSAVLPGIDARLIERVGKEKTIVHTHSIYDRVMQTATPVMLFPFDRGEVVSFDPSTYHDLYLTLRRVQAARGIEVIRFAAGLFPGNKFDPKSAVYPMLGIDFQAVEGQKSLIRGGPAGSTYDQLIDLKPVVRPMDYKMRRGESTDIVAGLTQADLDTYSKEVELGKDWEDIEDQALKIEVATRVIWQAIEAELDKDKPVQKISDATLDRIKRGLKEVKLENLAYPVVERIRKNILVAMFSSPHRFGEYIIKSGLTSWFFPEMKDMTWQEAVSKIEAFYTHESYRQAILNPTKETMRDFKDGWKIFDDLFGLQARHPVFSYLERVWQEATIK
ncbi:hypothetical protein A3C25_06105 [Candidatus Roizmanbacteria bacterium RIFCSPHIGHO2_02_FULL_38_11]|uniref:Uncharacterized protein n=1 Tax=Candidatus Roizmanbacteria bacterium RIFCSPHIGHO2_02_FULL_38_11 TaxID=1802039 RepID=A0A1F7H209_9BACT|nr:MAG: hypothetical protein A3C25_06105 [Candidatus Roizmanbacteria bacterium RIFCSPHIGHO2_02_FULL_38_11]